MWAKRWYSKEDVPSGHEALKRWLLVICWCCIKWLGPATEWKTVQKWIPLFRFQSWLSREHFLWFCIQQWACVLYVPRELSVYALRVFDRIEDKGDMLDQEHREERGRKAPFEAGLSNLSSSEPIQNLIFNLTNIAYFSRKHRSPQTTIQFT